MRANAWVLAICCVITFNASARENTSPPAGVVIDPDGTVQVPAFDMPLSIYMSDAAKQAFIEQSLHSPKFAQIAGDAVKQREEVDRVFLIPQLQAAKAAYAVTIEESKIGGVPVTTISPKEGVARENEGRVLINLHGGGFKIGAGVLQLVESIPVAGTARIKVISVDYRLAPEHKFPAGSEDVAAVYRELLKQYAPRNIGIYGSSAGGALVEMAVARFQKEKLPPPGAIGVLSPGYPISGGDSRYSAPPLSPLFGTNSPPPPAVPNPPGMPLAQEYFAGVDLNDPLVSPALHLDVLARFPPTLLVTGTRDFLASPVIQTHRQLVKANVIADLHVWDGMWHAFYEDVNLPESKELYAVMAKFFNAHLGRAEERRQ